MVINTDSDEVIDSIEVGMEPESMVIDKNETIMGSLQRRVEKRKFCRAYCNKYKNKYN